MFLELQQELQRNFDQKFKEQKVLFYAELDREVVFEKYLAGYPEISRQKFHCNCCKSFLRQYAGVIAIINNKKVSIWDDLKVDAEYQDAINNLSAYIKSLPITSRFYTETQKCGTPHNTDSTTGIKWYHLALNVPRTFVMHSNDIPSGKGASKVLKDLLERAFKEITVDSQETVLELIAQNSLYRGNEFKGLIDSFIVAQKEYEDVPSALKNNYLWLKSTEVSPAVIGIRNSVIGTLLTDLSEGVDLDTAVTKYESKVAPTNYKRPTAIASPKMIEAAKNTLQTLGLLDSLDRRFALDTDLNTEDILFTNRKSPVKDVFNDMIDNVIVNPKQFSKVEEITINDFIEKVLPTTTKMELLVENKHLNNFMTVLAPVNSNSPSLFKWDNGFSWAYTGGITDSIKENVKNAGGNIDAVMRFSIQWNDGNGKDNSDLDAHCLEPQGGDHIYFSHKISRYTGGELDIDITDPIYQCKSNGGVAVENITYPSKADMIPGTYKFFVNQFAYRGSQGFKAEIEVNGEIHSYEYNAPVLGNVDVAEVILDQSGNFKVVDKLPGNCATISKDVWGIKTLQFTPVSVVCYSPNYWDEQKGIGHQHLFFMLKDCINPEEPNGYYNEFLKPELEQHRRVFEALGAKAHVKDVDDQLSGVGFSLTKRNDLIIKVKGATERVLKVKF